MNEAFSYLKNHAIRFSLKGKPISNIEFKVMKNDLDKYSFDKKIKVFLKEGILMISPLEMQIVYKLHLGSDKDLEDAKYIYELFKDELDMTEMRSLVCRLRVEENFRERMRFVKFWAGFVKRHDDAVRSEQ